MGYSFALPPASYPAYSPAFPQPPGPTPTSAAVDRNALSSVWVAALLGLISGVLAVFNLFASPVSSIVSVSTGSSGSSVSLSLGVFLLAAAVVAAEFVITLLVIWYYREAFRQLAMVDGRFSTPSTLAMVALIALLVLVVAGIAFFVVLYQTIACAGSGNPIPSSCVNIALFLGFVGILGVAAIALLVGGIGLLFGIWRLGSRYNEGLFKAAAILLIFPVLNVVGSVLILVASRSLRDRYAGGTFPPSFG
jgi:hypothetical protein